MVHTGYVKKRIVIIGTGFGGIYTFLNLRKHLKSDHLEVVFINRTNYFLFTPLLHEVASGGIPQQHAAESVREIIHGYKADFYLAEVEKIDPNKKLVHTTNGDVAYDYLVIATGATTNFYGAMGASEHSFELKDLEDAIHIRNHIINDFEEASKIDDVEERKKRLSFAVVGGGPTGVELVAELSEFFYDTLERLYENIVTKSEVTLYLVNSGPTILKQFPTKLGKDAERALRRKHVRIIPNAHATEVRKDGLVLDTGEVLPTENVFWVAGVQPCIPKVLLQFEYSRSGRIVVNEHFQVKGHEDIFAIGDVASFVQDGHELPMLAQVATRQAKTLAENLLNSFHGRPMKKFRYNSLGSLVSVGQWYAVGDILGFKFSGFDVWMLWRIVYWTKFASWSKRWKIAADWTVNFFTPRDITKRH